MCNFNICFTDQYLTKDALDQFDIPTFLDFGSLFLTDLSRAVITCFVPLPRREHTWLYLRIQEPRVRVLEGPYPAVCITRDL